MCFEVSIKKKSFLYIYEYMHVRNYRFHFLQSFCLTDVFLLAHAGIRFFRILINLVLLNHKRIHKKIVYIQYIFGVFFYILRWHLAGCIISTFSISMVWNRVGWAQIKTYEKNLIFVQNKNKCPYIYTNICVVLYIARAWCKYMHMSLL